MTKPVRIAYFVHDAADPAVARRIAMLRAANGEITLFGFNRDRSAPDTVGGIPVIPLGRFADGDFLSRILAVSWAMARSPRLAGMIGDADAILARNLEALTVAAMVRRFAKHKPPLTYEILDIHRLLSNLGWKGKAVRLVERVLLGRCSLVITSSPAFVREHLRRYGRHLPEVMLVENKVLDPSGRLPAPAFRAAGPPWRVGWFGRLRCIKSLNALVELVRAAKGLLELDLRGWIELPIRDRFDAAIASSPHIKYGGHYSYADLPAIYGQVHFAWSVDFFEEGQNSTLLLPNRIYEGLANGAVPIAIGSVETGRWLARRGIGLVGEDLTEIARKLETMTPKHYDTLTAAQARLPAANFVTGEAECVELVARMTR
ncbi:glycosyltransferase [Bosea sp. NBC_00550]|uniref:glycosyltransferase n=1 Tax=Bosea sp. NBC_00550 TaxID=2969621 RepID=UPI00222F6080|nr:glycosyltransferase [Bosea sp. NBC_00550]UZF94394.1 glycosyl transferase family 1 [Bosea sp. NBC_00550]